MQRFILNLKWLKTINLLSSQFLILAGVHLCVIRDIRPAMCTWAKQSIQVAMLNWRHLLVLLAASRAAIAILPD